MKILWFTWKDKKNPTSGGAEVINEELAKRLVKKGHDLIFLVAGFKGSRKQEIIDGYKVIRLGNRYNVYIKALFYYKKYLSKWPDLIIEEINTIPFFTQFYTKQKRLLLIYQLCREIWFYQSKFPINILGYLLEPIYLKILSKNICITESESTKADLIKYGFDEKKIHLIPAATNLKPVKSANAIVKYPRFTLLSFGTIRKMKRTEDQIRAFEIAKNKIGDLHLIVAGSPEGNYGKYVLNLIKNSKYASDITHFNFVTEQKKIELMSKSHLLLVTSVKEGWGLVVTEAASQTTPSIVYDVDGLRKSVITGVTGIICKKNTPEDLAENIIRVYDERKYYRRIQMDAHKKSRNFTFDKSYYRFKNILQI